MKEPATLPSPNQPESSAEVPSSAESSPSNRSSLLPVLCAIGFLILAGALAYVWSMIPPADRVASESHDFDAMNQRLSDLDTRVRNLDQRPPAATPEDLSKLSSRLDAVEGKLSARLDTVESRLNAFEGRLNTFDGKLANQSQLASRLDTMSARIESLATRDQMSFDNINQQLTDIANRANAAQSAAAGVTAMSQRIDLLAKLEQAALALSVGRPLGEVPGAPPAISKYAHTPPPTEAHLRETYPSAQAEALSRQQPENASAPLVDRMWERAQGLVTVRRGDEVVVGDTTSMFLSQAQAALELGNLPAAVQAVKQLKGEPAKAMSGWLAEAEGLVNARAALAQMAQPS